MRERQEERDERERERFIGNVFGYSLSRVCVSLSKSVEDYFKREDWLCECRVLY